MKLLLVSWMLLLYGASLNTAHYIRRIENGESMVYSLKDPSGVTILGSELGKPTLREVLYYHIERPFGKEFLKEYDDAASSEENEYDETHNEEYRDSYDEDENEEVGQHYENELEGEIQGVGREETKPTMKPLTDKDVKEAYKSRSYLFDQMRQRYLPLKRMVSPDSSRRRKRQVESEMIPEAPQLSGGSKEDYIKPNTYGMNLKPEGGYVWNNMNNPPVYYELGQSPNGYPSEGHNESGQSQENQSQRTETKEPPQGTDSNASGSSEGISTDRQPATPLDNQEIGSVEAKAPEILPEDVKESVETDYNPIAPIINENRPTESETLPAEPVFNDDSSPEDYNPDVEKPVFESPENPAPAQSEESQFEKPASSEDLDLPEVSTEYSEVDKIKDIPEAPTLPPLNYDSLPDYIRDAVSSTEKSDQNQSGQSQENQPPPTETKEPPQLTESNASGSSEVIYVSTDKQPEKPLDNQEIGSTNAKEPEILPDDDKESVNTDDNPVTPIINENVSTEGDKLSAEPVVNGDSSPENYNPGAEKPVFERPENPVTAESEESRFEKPASSEGSDKSEVSTEYSEVDKIKDIPDAPTLPPLNYDNLPDYIRDAISSTEKTESVEHTDNPYTNPQLDPEDKKTLEDKMEDIFATVQPVEDIPKTHGMNLSSGGGQVWNVMVNPPVSYNIGAPDSNEKEQPKAPETSEEPKEESEYIPKPVENQPEIKERPEDEFSNAEGNKEAEIAETTNFEQPENLKPAQENEKPSGSTEEPVEAVQPGAEVPTEPVESVTQELPGNTDTSIQDPSNPESGQVAKPNGEAAESGDQPAEPKPEETDKKPDIMSELLKSEQFWKWLGEWTATYMELLEKHMRKIAIQEICNREKTGSQMCLLDGQPEDNGPTIKDCKVIMDGKEIPLTHTNNLDDLLRRGNKDDTGHKVNANAIYGNSVGNEKVTNVFIFNADNTKEILEDLKPENNSKVDVFINESNKDDKEAIIADNIEPKIEEQIPKETKVEDKTIDKSTENTESDFIIDDRSKVESKIKPKIPEDELPKDSKKDESTRDEIIEEDDKYLE